MPVKIHYEFLNALRPACVKDQLIVNGMGFDITPKTSMGKHPDFVVRDFGDDHNCSDNFVSEIAEWCAGEITDVFDQILSYSKAGIVDHRTQGGIPAQGALISS